MTLFFIAAFLLCHTIADASVKVGVILPFTGHAGPVGIKMGNAIDLALRMLNDGEIDLVFANNYTRPDCTRVVAERLVEDDEVVALMGGYPSKCSRIVCEVADRGKVPYLIVSSSSDSLTILSDENILRICPPSTEYNDGLVDFIVSVIGENSTLSVIYEDHLRSRGAVADIRGDLQRRWHREVVYVPFEPGERDFGEIIKRLADQRVKVPVIIGGTIDAAWFILQCRENDWAPDAIILGAGFLVGESLISLADGAADYVIGPVIWHPVSPFEKATEFSLRYYEQYGSQPDYRAAEAFAAVEVMIHAARRVESGTPVDLLTALKSTDITTVFGDVRFENYSHFSNQNRVQTTVVQRQGDRWVSISPTDNPGGSYIYPIPAWNERHRETDKRPERSTFLILTIIACVILLATSTVRRREILRKMKQ